MRRKQKTIERQNHQIIIILSYVYITSSSHPQNNHNIQLSYHQKHAPPPPHHHHHHRHHHHHHHIIDIPRMTLKLGPFFFGASKAHSSAQLLAFVEPGSASIAIRRLPIWWPGGSPGGSLECGSLIGPTMEQCPSSSS